MPKQDGFIASVSLDAVANGPTVQFIRWQVHGDWVQQVRSALTTCLTGWGVAAGTFSADHLSHWVGGCSRYVQC